MRHNNQNKTGYHDDLFNRVSHYNHLLEASENHNRKDELEYKLLVSSQQGRSRFDSKLYKSSEKQRKTNNNILLKKLIAIHKKKPQPESDRYDDLKKRQGRSLQYRSLEADRQLHKQNRQLMGKLYKVKPKVGSQSEWDEHYSRFVTNQRKLSKVVPQLMVLDSQFYSTFTDLYSRGSHRRISLQSESKETVSHSKPGTSIEGQHPCPIHGRKPTTAIEKPSKKEDDDLLIDPQTNQLELPAMICKPTKRRRSRKKKESNITTAQLYVLGSKGDEETYQRLLDEYEG